MLAPAPTVVPMLARTVAGAAAPSGGSLLDTFLGAQPLPQRPVVALTAIIAVVAVLYRPVWIVLRHVVTIAHEGGHAAVAAATGRRLHGVRLHSDTSGLTISAGRPTGIGVVLTLLAGYLSPSVLGLAAAAALGSGRVLPVLWVSVVLLAALLVMIRNLFGVLSVLATAAALVGVAGWAPAVWQGPAAYLLTWFLLVAGPRPVLELQGARRRRLVAASDADQLARLTRIPGLVWVGVFLLLTTSALAGGAWLLVSPAPAG
ncbi:MAG TPA: M50 family metallopeptidase [Kineosporiaceae bacterium]